MLKELGQTPRGYIIWVEDNGVGGNRYWSDENGMECVVWDTCLAAPETLRYCLEIEENGCQVNKVSNRETSSCKAQ